MPHVTTGRGRFRLHAIIFFKKKTLNHLFPLFFPLSCQLPYYRVFSAYAKVLGYTLELDANFLTSVILVPDNGTGGGDGGDGGGSTATGPIGVRDLVGLFGPCCDREKGVGEGVGVLSYF